MAEHEEKTWEERLAEAQLKIKDLEQKWQEAVQDRNKKGMHMAGLHERIRELEEQLRARG
jgi:hypothetical protein